ncbi:hypothetical protein PMIN03_006144 [Paraphaeosphaeria minitans]
MLAYSLPPQMKARKPEMKANGEVELVIKTYTVVSGYRKPVEGLENSSWDCECARLHLTTLSWDCECTRLHLGTVSWQLLPGKSPLGIAPDCGGCSETAQRGPQ